jgi:hypothetical protein
MIKVLTIARSPACWVHVVEWALLYWLLAVLIDALLIRLLCRTILGKLLAF